MQIGESRYAFDADYSTLLDKTANKSSVSGGKTVLTFTFTVMEPIRISPMYFSAYALHGVKDMTYSATFANHERMICAKADLPNVGLKIDSIIPKLDVFELHFGYSTAKLLSKQWVGPRINAMELTFLSPTLLLT